MYAGGEKLTHVIYIKPFSKILCLVDGGLVVPVLTVSIRLEMSHHRRKMISQPRERSLTIPCSGTSGRARAHTQ